MLANMNKLTDLPNTVLGLRNLGPLSACSVESVRSNVNGIMITEPVPKLLLLQLHNVSGATGVRTDPFNETTLSNSQCAASRSVMTNKVRRYSERYGEQT